VVSMLPEDLRLAHAMDCVLASQFGASCGKLIALGPIENVPFAFGKKK
jgi:hypothetical protein